MRTGLYLMYLVLGVLSVAVLAYGLSQGEGALAGGGFVGALLVGTMLPIAVRLWHDDEPGGAAEARVDRGLRELAQAVRELTDRSALSDDARRVINRARERELLCKAIEEDIQKRDWDAGLVLVGELADRFGYRAEAEQFRTRIEAARAETVDREVRESIDGLDRLVTQLRWDEASEEARRIGRLFPQELAAQKLGQRVDIAREKYKLSLERRFLVAAEAERIDEAMELLRELDGYLTREEAESFQEAARGVVGKAKENLGVGFKLAVQDRRWTDAARLGEKIIEEFPNSRMADEIRGMIDEIRERASAMARTG